MLSIIPISTWVIIPCVIITIILASFFKRRAMKLSVITLSTLMIIMEMISIYFSGGFVDYQFFVNLNVNDIIEGLFIFKLQALLSVVVFFVLLFILFKLSALLQKKLNVIIRLAAFAVAVISLNYHNGPIDKFAEIYQVVSAPAQDFNLSLQQLNIENYVAKADINATRGKNIIVISLESFEQGFLDFNDVTPNLNQLREQYTFYPHMPMAIGSSWTTASMYTYMTGMPLLVGGFNTTPLSNIKETQLVSLGDVLNRADYQMRYVIGSPTFAGIGHIINLFGVEIISEKSYPGEYPDAPFGLYDKDVFDIAKRQVNELSKNDKPFALFISTISTHAPNGFYDERMVALLEKTTAIQEDNMTFVAKSLDYNLGQFIRYLEEEGILNDTVFYIFPDHLMMGAGTPTIANLAKQQRSLYLLTNADEQALPIAMDQNIYQIDLPRMILNGAEIKTNGKFLTDYLALDMDKQAYIEQNKSVLATINRSAGIE